MSTRHSSRALEHGAAADGAKYLKPGFAFNEEDDQAFALGWPNMIRLVEDEADPEETALQMKKSLVPEIRDWPVQATHRLLRLMGTGRPGKTPTQEQQAALTIDEALSEDEGAELFSRFLDLPWTSWILPLLASHAFEAVIGPSRVAKLFVEALESNPELWLESSNPRCNFVLQLGYHLLRVPTAEAVVLRERLESLLEAHRELINLDKKANNRALRKLDLVLHGKRGAERSGHRVDGGVVPHELLLVHDDPDYVFEQASALGTDASSRVEGRLAFLAGERWLELERDRWRRYTSPTAGIGHRCVVNELGAIRSKTVAEIMLDMAARSKAKRNAKAWFKEHAEFAAPVLRNVVEKKGEHAELAGKLLKKL